MCAIESFGRFECFCLSELLLTFSSTTNICICLFVCMFFFSYIVPLDFVFFKERKKNYVHFEREILYMFCVYVCVCVTSALRWKRAKKVECDKSQLEFVACPVIFVWWKCVSLTSASWAMHSRCSHKMTLG